MARIRQRDQWNHTAWLAALIANCNRDPKRKPTAYTPDDFNPMVEKPERGPDSIVVTKENIGDMRLAFTSAFDRKG